MKRTFKNILPAALLFIGVIHASGQDHAMHMQHTMQSPGKNTYLAMMDTMMSAMDHAPEGKSPEAGFLLQMIPHHLGAVAMARYEISHGKNFVMIQLAKSILAEQQSEIAAMQIWLQPGKLNGASLSADFKTAMSKSMSDMMAAMPADEHLADTDKAFAHVMLPHHQAAIAMAKAVLDNGKDQQVLAFAKMLISNEQIEIQQMSTYIK